MKNAIRFGIVGCGRISYKHIEAIAGMYPDAVLTCVCDIIGERAEKTASDYSRLCISEKTLKQPMLSEHKNEPEIEAQPVSPHTYTSLAEMLECEQIDILSVCTPSGLHPVHGISAARKGINVLTEKPMAIDLNSADALIQACENAGVRLFVVKQNRLNSTMQLLKQAIDKGRFGKLYMLLSNVLWLRPQSYYDQAGWRGTWALDGGAFLNQASHYVDSLQWLGGPVESVTAVTSRLSRNIEAEDTGSAIIKFKSGAIGNINATMLVYPNNLEGSITVIGEKGTVRIGGVAINKIEQWKFDAPDKDDDLVNSSCYEPPNVYGYGHTGYYRNVLEVLKGNAEPNTDGNEGRKSLEIITGIYISSHCGMTVQLPLKSNKSMRNGEFV